MNNTSKKEIYIIDTNVLVYDPKSLFSFDDNWVGLSVNTLEELDKFKSESSQRGYNSREVIRKLDSLRNRGSLREGVQLDNGGYLIVLFEPENHCEIPFTQNITDNKILLTAYCLKQQGYVIKFISKDINLRVKADILDIEAHDYEKGRVSKSDFYRGWRSFQVPSIQLKKDRPEELLDLSKSNDILINEFIILESKNNPFNFVLFRYLGENKFKKVEVPQLKWHLEPRNVHQLMALDLLLDNSIQLISLVGPAGTGKTFLALLAGLDKVLIEHEYEKMLISRPVIPLGADIGYLPGDIQEKLFSWMQPIYDNMDFLSHKANITVKTGMYKEEEEMEEIGNHKKKKKHSQKIIPSLDDLIAADKVNLDAITYMRGRSIPYQYILIDEVQNLTPHEVKTLITRVGEGSKMILAGDPYQIDSPYLDFSSNGLVVATDKFKGQKILALYT